jgi:hypothetical protein
LFSPDEKRARLSRYAARFLSRKNIGGVSAARDGIN